MIDVSKLPEVIDVDELLRQIELEIYEEYLRRVGGNKQRASWNLCLLRTTLIMRLKKLRRNYEES